MPMKIRLFWILMVMWSLLTAVPALAQTVNPAAEPLPPETFEQEPPLTYEDLNSFIDLAPVMAQAARNPAAFERATAAQGLTTVRFGYILNKVSLGVSLAMGMTREQFTDQGVPEAMMPTDAEMEYIKPRQAQLVQAVRIIAGEQRGEPALETD